MNGIYTKQNNRLDVTVKTVLKHTIQRAKACFGEGSFDDASLVLISLNKELYPKVRANSTNNMNYNNNNNNNNSSSNSNPSSDAFMNATSTGPSDRTIINGNTNHVNGSGGSNNNNDNDIKMGN